MNNSQSPRCLSRPAVGGQVGQSGTRIGVLATCGYNYCHFCQRSGCKTYVYISSMSVSYVSRAIFESLFELPRSLDRGSRPSKSPRRRLAALQCGRGSWVIDPHVLQKTQPCPTDERTRAFLEAACRRQRPCRVLRCRAWPSAFVRAELFPVSLRRLRRLT